jgi:hypothetical protein
MPEGHTPLFRRLAPTNSARTAARPELNGALIFAGARTNGDFSGFMNGSVQPGNSAGREILDQKKIDLPKVA